MTSAYLLNEIRSPEDVAEARLMRRYAESGSELRFEDWQETLPDDDADIVFLYGPNASLNLIPVAEALEARADEARKNGADLFAEMLLASAAGIRAAVAERQKPGGAA